jgi:LytR cell envelope-related transcriptional attenuator
VRQAYERVAEKEQPSQDRRKPAPVEHSLRIEPQERPWRTLTLIATVVASIEFLILFGAFVAKPLVGHLKRAAVSSATASAEIPKPPPVGTPQLTRGETSVLVLNGNGRTGAAAAEATRVRARGYRIGSVDDAQRTDYTRSIVMYRAGYRPEAVRLARDLRVGVVGPLDGMKAHDLLGSQLALIVGSK